jgi:hypothetical protein
MNIYKEVINNYEDLLTRKIRNNHPYIIFSVLNKESSVWKSERHDNFLFVMIDTFTDSYPLPEENPNYVLVETISI